MFVVVCYQKICQLGSKEHLHAFSVDCKVDKLKKGEGGRKNCYKNRINLIEIQLYTPVLRTYLKLKRGRDKQGN